MILLIDLTHEINLTSDTGSRYAISCSILVNPRSDDLPIDLIVVRFCIG
jgi:hypothetical protein